MVSASSPRPLFDRVARAASFAGLYEVVLLRQLFHMQLNSVAVRAGRILDFFDGNLVTRFRQFQNLAGKGGQGRAQRPLLFHLCGQVVFLLHHRFQKEDQPGFPVLLLLANRLLRAAQGEVVAIRRWKGIECCRQATRKFVSCCSLGRTRSVDGKGSTRARTHKNSFQ